MRQPHIYALSAALALTTVLIFVVGGDPVPEPRAVAAAQVLSAEVGRTTTTMDLDFSGEAAKHQVLSAVEVELTEDAATRSTTTTTTLPTAGPLPPKKPSDSAPRTTASTTTTQPPSPASTVTAEYRSDYESEFDGLINSLRASSGLPALARNGSLDARARDWAKTMAESGSIKHSNLGSLVPPWLTAAENVGTGGTVSAIFGLFKGSAGHLASMVGNYTDIGIGVWRDSSGTLWTVHVFAG